MELRKGAAVTTVEWPASSAAECGAWLREWWMIRGDALWLSVAPLDMRASMDTILAKAAHVFGEARPHHAYLFANRRRTRMKVLVQDSQGIWLACWRLNQGRMRWAGGNLVEP